MPKNLLDMRLGVRSAEGLRSLVWRLFATSKGDVYFAIRSMMGVVKYSFHQSGICRSAFTAERGNPAILPDRAMYKWNRAPISIMGEGRSSRVLLLACPTDFLSRLPDKGSIGTIAWIEAAPAGGAAYLSISFTAEPENVVERAYAGNGTRLLSHTALSTEVNLLVDYYHADWENNDLTVHSKDGTKNLLFSASDPNMTGRPIRLVFGPKPNDGDALHVRELGGYAL